MESKQQKRESFVSHIRCWEESGQSQKEYCQLNGLNYQTFLYYRKHLKSEISPAFAEIRLPAVKVTDVCLYSIEFPNRSVVRVYQSVEADFLSAIARSCK
jgi:hypothetical protein